MDRTTITFGIVTSYSTQIYLQDLLNSIKAQNIPDDLYEIIIVGNCDRNSSGNVKVIPFDDSLKKGWITKKKNLITENSSFEFIVFLHDYLFLSRQWYKNFLDFGTDWDLLMNSLINHDGKRMPDWMGLPDDREFGNVLFPYNYEGSNGMYIPGYFWVARKSSMLEFPLNEDFVWGEGEDIEWSKRVLGGYPPRWLKNISDFDSNKLKIGKLRYSLNSKCHVFSRKKKNFSIDFFKEYDLHSGDESRPLPSIPENYNYLKFR